MLPLSRVHAVTNQFEKERVGVWALIRYVVFVVVFLVWAFGNEQTEVAHDMRLGDVPSMPHMHAD